MARRRGFSAHSFSLRHQLAKSRLALRQGLAKVRLALQRWLQPWRALAGREALLRLRQPRWVKLNLEALEDIAAPTNIGLEGWLGQAALAPFQVADTALLHASSDATPMLETGEKSAATGVPDEAEQLLSELASNQIADQPDASGDDIQWAARSHGDPFSVDATDDSDPLSLVVNDSLDASADNPPGGAKQDPNNSPATGPGSGNNAGANQTNTSPNQAGAYAGAGQGPGGSSTPNAGMGGGGSMGGGGGGPGLVNANQFVGVNFGAPSYTSIVPSSNSSSSAAAAPQASATPGSSGTATLMTTTVSTGSSIVTSPVSLSPTSTSSSSSPPSSMTPGPGSGSPQTSSLPVLDTVQRFGPFDHQRLFIQGSLANTAPLGTSVTLDFYAREPGVADQFLGSKAVTQTAAGSVSFLVNLEANVPDGTLIAAAVHGSSGGPAWDQGAFLPGGPSSVQPNSSPPDTVTVMGANGEPITLESPGHPLFNVQVLTPPGLSDAMPMGLVSFTVTNVPVGGPAIVRMILPSDVHVQHYYKQDPVTGIITPFDYDGRTGAEINGNVITLHLLDGGPGDGDGTANGVIVDPGGPGTILPGNVAVAPAATTAELVTLESPGHPFTTVQTYDPPATGDVLPLGLFGFTITGVPVGGAANVQMVLPNDVYASHYIEQDPQTRVLSAFDYDGQYGSEIHGHTITLHLKDGGPGDDDHVADGVITDPGGPGAGSITIPTTGWTNFQTGGSASGQGSVTFNSSNSTFVINEGDSFDTGMKHDFTIPTSPTTLTFNYSNLLLDTGTGQINDAFEAAFVDANGNSLVPTIAPGRNSFFNVSAGMQPLYAAGVSVSNGAVNLPISELFAGTTGTLIFRLVNNDGQNKSTVTISAYPPPGVTLALANDTAPSGPNVPQQFFHDGLTNDPTITGTATDSAGITDLQASVDGGALIDIYNTLDTVSDQYTWNPGNLSYGSHTITVTATDSAQQKTTTAPLTFELNAPATANAGGNQTVNEGDLATFDGTGSSETESYDKIYSYQWTFPDGSTASGPYASYKFLQPGTYTVTLAVTDDAGSISTDTATVTVLNVAPTVNPIPDQTINEAGTATMLASFTDPGPLDTHTAKIDWGDGSGDPGNIQVKEANGSGTVTATHPYGEEGTYKATLTVTDNGGLSGSASFVVNVIDVPPTLTISGPSSVNEGSLYVLNLAATPGPDPVSNWIINWGDGTPLSPPFPPGATSASHSYADGPKQFTITATATDDDGTLNASPLVVMVNNIPPTLSISGASSVNEGALYTLNLSGTPDSVDHDTITGWKINWGDGDTETYANNPNSEQHTYLDGDGSYTITATAMDADGSYSAGSLIVAVNNVPPTITQINNVSGQAGQTLTFSAAFTDPGVQDTHKYKINWGDSYSNSGPANDSGGGGTVSGTHIWSTPGTYTITLTVTDDDGGSTSETATATITAIPINPTISGPSSVNEGAIDTLNLSSTGSTPTGWTINWGDGNTINYSGNPPSEQHQYADGPNQYTITATATDQYGTYASNALAVTVNAIPPTVSISGAASVNEGSLYTLNLSAIPDSWDQDQIQSWKIIWGDGMSSSPGGQATSATHTYLDGDGSYTITASAYDENGSYASNSVTVTVNNVAPTVTAENLSGNEGQKVSFFGTFTDPGVLDTHKNTTINWGDNSTSPGTVVEQNGSGSVTGTHTYADEGNYTITLTVTDDDGGTGSQTATASIASVAPTVTAAPDPTEVKNEPFSQLLVATFTDPGFTNAAAGTVESFTASIDWGDNSTGAGSVTVTQGSDGVLTTGSVSGSHTYTAAGDYTVTVTVVNDDNLSNTVQLTLHVLSHGPAQFWVVDQSAHQIFSYDKVGNLAGSFDLSHNNQRGWGIATNAKMDTLWVVDANKNVQVYVYNPITDKTIGNWIASGVKSAQDIATDGGNIWILDDGADTVDYFPGGANFPTGGAYTPSPLNSTSTPRSFVLNSADKNPTGMVTDGSSIWVTDDQAGNNRVFVYDISGAYLGSWQLDPADTTPVGITLNPNYQRGTATDMWVVDQSTDKVYDYAGGSVWRSGSHTATSTFALDANDHHPEGIADPILSLQTPSDGSSFAAGSSYLVSGQVTPSATTVLEGVSVNGTGATVDAGGNFFQQETVGLGTNPVNVTGTDSGGTATKSLNVTGTAPVTASPSNPGAIDFSMLSDVTPSMSASYGNTSFNNGTSILYASFTAANIGSYTINTPLLVGVSNISAPSVRVRNNTGLLTDGTPFYDLSSLVTGTPPTLGPGQTIGTSTLSFYDPEGVPFTYDLEFLGELNHPPRFTSVPVVTVVAGQVYNYTVTGADPDDDNLTFSKVAGPQNMYFTDTHAGTLTWTTSTSDAGTYAVQLQVSDNRGGTALQSFILTVLPDDGTNYPPYFTSTPVVSANVSTPYTYQATAADLDNDSHTFSLVSGQYPAGMTVSASGLVQWTPTADELGTAASTTVTVELQVTDTGFPPASGPLSATQTYSILLQQAPGNDPPIFITTPPNSVLQNGTYVSSLAAGSFFVYPAKAIDADGDPIAYTLTAAPGSMVIDPTTGQIVWQTYAANANNSYAVTILASDGRGGTAEQSFTVSVTAAGPALAALTGTKYNDLDGNGQRDLLPPPSPSPSTINLQTASLANTPYALDYDQPLNSMMIVAQDSSGNFGIYRVRPDGTELLYAKLPGLGSNENPPPEGSSLSIVGPGNPYFTSGDMFVPGNSTSAAAIAKVSDGGATVNMTWATLPLVGQDGLPCGGTVLALTMDQTGLFGYNLLALVQPASNYPEVWEIHADGTATQVASLKNYLTLPSSEGENGMLVIPNDTSLYGPAGSGGVAGQLLILEDTNDAVIVSPTGQVNTILGSSSPYGQPSTAPFENAEGVAIATPGDNFFAIADRTPSISVADGSPFDAYAGQLIVAHEGTSPDYGWFDRVYWNGTQLQVAPLTFTDPLNTNLPWYHDTFAPVGLGPVSPPALEPGLPNWTINLDDTTANKQYTTTTDANGNYGFFNLPAGDSYTVSEVQQTGWTQRGPTPVPPGTWTVTPAAGQTISGLDFGNQQLPPPPPSPLPPPTGSPGSAPSFTSTAPNPGTATVSVPFLYDAAAADADGDPLTFDLPVHPAGMAVDPKLGVVAWQPTPDQLGLSANVLLRVTDTEGLVALQWFTVNVTGTDYPPVITSTPVTTSNVNQSYQYQVEAQDAENSKLTYSLTSDWSNSGPPGTPAPQIDSNGLVTWTPPLQFFGQVNITVSVSDGLYTVSQTYTLTVQSSGTDTPPVITSTPRSTIALGQTYYYQVQANDPDFDVLTYTLPTYPAGMTINATTGLVTWTPTTSQAGSNNVTVQVADSQNNTATQSFTINVADVAVNHPPVITSTPPLTAWVGEQYYAYNATATDPDGDPIAWHLVSGPRGMSVNPNIGTVRWIPTLDQIGPQTVTLQAVDPYGGSATQTWIINVLAVNTPPVITSIPPTQAVVNQLYSYAIQASDADGDALQYSVTGFPNGSGGYSPPGSPPNPTNAGLFTGTPMYAGPATVTVTVTDDAGLTATQEYIVNVASSPPNYAPVITSTPSTLAANSQAYNYQVLVTDQDGDAQTYSLSTRYTGTGGPTISSTGLVNWASPVAGTYQFTVTVTDAGGAQAVQTYDLTVENDTKPAITNWNPPTTITAGLSYRYDVQASDSDNDALTFALSNAPTGMTIDSYGRISWAPGIPQIGVYNNITVTVTDPFGNTATDSFNLTVAADTKPPSVELTLNTNPLNVNQQETLLVFASDNVGVTSLSLTWSNGGAATNLDIDSKGQAFFTPTAAGNYTFTATASDAAGNTATATQTLTVSNPNGTPPTITLTAPIPANGVDPNITAPTAVTGTVSDDHVGVSYTVTVIPYDGSPSFQIGSGSTTTANSLTISNVTFDPTMLANGDYKIEIKATDTDDNLTTTLDQHVSVSGDLKLGRETLSVTDLTIPVAGIPISIIRNYDSLEAGVNSDFGYGWTLSYGDAKLETDLVPGADIGWGGFPAFLDGTRVYVTMPGGDREGFTFDPTVTSDTLGLTIYYHPHFDPDPGVEDTLTAPDALLTKDPDSGEYYSITDSGIDTYNPEDPNYGGTYKITTPDRLNYTVNATNGKLLSVSDRRGNKLTFTSDGIESNAGRKVVISRDPEGRITAITDPNNHSLLYAYDVNGNLVSETDRIGNMTQYVYRTDLPHYLSQVIDPFGRTLATIDYSPQDGRMQDMVDGFNQKVQFSYDLSQSTQYTMTVTDQYNNSSTMTYDPLGNLTSDVNYDGKTTLYQYKPGTSIETAETQVIGLPDSPSNGETDDLTTQFVVDNSGRMTASIDPLGKTTYYNYDTQGNLISVSDPIGDTTYYAYDENGSLSSITDALGHTKLIGLDPQGDFTSLTEPTAFPSGTMPPSQGPPPAAVSTFGYDIYGDLVSAVDTYGNPQSHTYDGNGNQTAMTRTWVNPNDSSDQRTVSVTSQYDGDDRLTQTTAPSGTTQYQYDKNGNVYETVTPQGITQTVYDARRSLIQSTDTLGRVSQLVYDAKARLVWRTDAHFPGQAADGTHYIYDNENRIVEVDRYANVVIALQPDPVWPRVQISVLQSYGTQLSTESTVYDDAGRVAQHTDVDGLTTYYQYDKDGHETGHYYIDSGGVQRWTKTTYDAAGQALTVTDANNHTTQYIYDDDGRVVKSIYADGTWTENTYDVRGNTISETDQLGRVTNFEYDLHDKLTLVQLPQVFDPETNQNVRPEYDYSYDNYGNLIGIKDPKGRVTSFSYDEEGRKVSETLPQVTGQATLTAEWTYNANGLVQTETDFKGQVTYYIYDSQDRVIQAKYYNSQTDYQAGNVADSISYSYDTLDSAGLHDDVTDSRGTTDYLYDQEGRLIRASTPEGTVNYAYDPASGNLTQTSTANTSVSYQYDHQGRLQTVKATELGGVTLATPQVTTYDYDPVGNLISVQYPNNVQATYQYDALNRVTGITYKNAGGATLASFQYVLGADGMRDKVTESELEADGTTATTTVNYSYDALNRLVQEVSTSSLSSRTYTTNYVYDIASNLLQKTTTDGSGNVDQVADQYNALDELTQETESKNGTVVASTSLAYDANGSLISESTQGGATATYTYNLRNLLSGATINRQEGGHQVQIQTTYKYDEDGNRVQDTVAETIDGGTTSNSSDFYVLDKENPSGYAQILEVLPTVGQTPTTTYVIGKNVLSQHQGGSDLFLLPDALGSTRSVSDSLGNVKATYDYSAYGNVLNAVIGALTPPMTDILFAGQLIDINLLQYEMRARIYDPVTGRFTQRDSFPGIYTIPISLNKFIYTHDNPGNFTDPSGHEIVELGVVMNIMIGTLSYLAAATVRGREATAANFRQIFKQSMLINLGLSYLDDRLWPYLPFAAFVTFRQYNKISVQPQKILEQDLKSKIDTLNRANTNPFDKQVAFARGLTASVNGYIDFASVALDPFRRRYSNAQRHALNGYRLVVNAFLLGNYALDNLAAEIASGLMTPFLELSLGTTWHHSEVLGIYELVPTKLHGNNFDHVGGVWWYRVASGIKTYPGRFARLGLGAEPIYYEG